MTYEIASGDRIPNLGQRVFAAESAEGVTRRLTAQVCDVNKALLSVQRVVSAGNSVHVTPDGAYIEDVESGERMALEHRNGLYFLKIWVRRDGGSDF